MNERVKDSVSVSLELSLVTMLVNLLSCLLLSLSSSRSLSLVKSLLLLRIFPEGVCNFKPVPCHALTVETCGRNDSLPSRRLPSQSLWATFGRCYWKNGMEMHIFAIINNQQDKTGLLKISSEIFLCPNGRNMTQPQPVGTFLIFNYVQQVLNQ